MQYRNTQPKSCSFNLSFPQTAFGPTADFGHFRQWRHFRQPMKPEHTSGVGLSPTSPTHRLRTHHPLRSLPARRHFRQPMKPGPTSGVCHLHRRTAFGLTPRSGHFRPRRHFRQPMEPGQTSGARPPTGPPSTGYSQLLPPCYHRCHRCRSRQI